MDIKPFENYQEGDCLSFGGEIYCYLKTRNGKQISFGIRAPYGISKIESYELPTDDDMLMQAVDQMICEVCMFNEYCYMGMCMLTFVKEHHTIENVSIMPSNGNMQFTKQSIGNDRFDVMAFAVDEYCKGNTALLLVHCTPEFQNTLKECMHSICFDSEQIMLNTILYFEKIYNINDIDLIQNLIESGKKAIDSAQRVLEYIELAYRVWICRSNKYMDVTKYDKSSNAA